ncbi:MAG: VWA domain-containing protein [Terriglobia bacterium]|jgi:VWFA-related protein
MNFAFERRYRGLGPTPFGPACVRAWEPIWQGGMGVTLLLLFVGLLGAGLFSGVPAAAGQGSGEQEIATQDVQSPFKVQVQRNMVVVRAIVRDSNGRPVPRLRKEDFRLLDNGKPQEIDQFALESSSRTSAVARPAPGKESDEEAASEAGAANATARNFQALYFDDLQMTFEDIAHARDAADRYLATTLTAADRAGIFTSSGQGNLDFTDDRSKLHEALFKLRPRPNISTDTNSCPDIGDYQAYLIVQQRDPFATEIATQEVIQCNCEVTGNSGMQQACSSQAANMVEAEAMRVWNDWETQSEAVLRGLEQVIRRTALLPGQHSVIFLSPGFLRYNLESQIAEIADRALRSSVVISALDPRGLYVIIPGGDASRQPILIPGRPDLMGRKQQIIDAGFSLAEEVLSDLAGDTGGQFFHNSNDLDTGFRQVGTLSDVYYVLAFSPRNLKFDGRFHRLKVSLVNPAGFTIQARRGYFAPKASVDVATKAKEEIEQAVYSQDELKELPINVHTQFFKVNEAEARLAVLTHLDLSSVRFRKEQDRHLNKLTFLTVLFDRDGKYVVGKEKVVEFRLRDATLARLNQTGITLKMEFDLKPGTYLVRQIVRDSEAGQLSGLNRTVEIPY